jgi:hypothetical protein
MSRQPFNGQSTNGDFQEALSHAIQNALNFTSAMDALVTWKLAEVKGEKGGIAGLNNISVTIDATISP